LFIGVVGPVRIVRRGAQVPAEIRRFILVQAIVLPLTGIVLAVSGMLDAPRSVEWAGLLVGLLLPVSAYAGFYALSTKLPRTFRVSEMLSIMKSAGITGDKKNSPADREMMRWTKGIRDGVMVGEAAPDGTVVTMEGQTVLLSSFFGENPSSPLVLNFASYSCPHFRRRVVELHTLMDRWQDQAVRFLTVYTAEAHPEDGWKLAHQYDNDNEYTNEDDFRFYYSKGLDDRIKMARWLQEKKNFRMRIVIDAPENDLLRTYNTWPIRLYIVNDGKIAYCGEQGPFGFDPSRADKALQDMMNLVLNKTKL